MQADDPDGDVPVTLRLRPGAEPIQGCAEGPGGVARGFFGWLELASILEQVRGPFRQSDHDAD